MSAPTNMDALLRAAGNMPEADPLLDEAAFTHGDATWRRLEAFLEERAQSVAAGREAPGLPGDLAAMLVSRPSLRRAYAALATPVAEARGGKLPVARELPPSLRAALRAEADRQRQAAAPGVTESLGALLAATFSFVAQKWQALSTSGFELIHPELLLARNAADAPIAMQGCLGDRYLVALSLSGDPRHGAAAFDLQCQEVRPGSATPKPVPAFCLLAPDGRRYHSRDRIAHVEAVGAGRHIYTLEVVGRATGKIVVEIAE